MQPSAFSDAASAGDLATVEKLVQEMGELDRGAAVRMAAEKGRLEVVQFLTGQCDAGSNTMDPDGCTALMRAAEQDHVDVVQYLAEQRGVDMDARSNGGSTAMILAAGRGHLDVVRALAGQHGADVGIKDNGGHTALIWAAANGHVDIVRFLVDECSADVGVLDDDGQTVLMWAAGQGHMDIVRFLTDQEDTDVDIKDKYGCTALMLAASWGHEDVVRFLAQQHDADVNVLDNYRCTALMRAAENGHVGIVRFLVQNHGADANSKNKDGRTALVRAAENGHIGVVRVLVELHGVDLNSKDNDGRRALVYAAENGHMAVVEVLAGQLEADVDEKDKHELAPLAGDADMKGKDNHTALNLGWRREDIERFFAHQEHEADMNMLVNYRCTALMRAAENGHVGIVRFLVQNHGADANSKDKDGRTALMRAAENGHIGVVRFLVQNHGADTTREDNDGRSALVWAARRGHVDIVKFLTDDHDADVKSKGNVGQTVLVWAAENGHVDLVRFLAWQQDNITHSALMWGAEHGSIDVVRYFAEHHGADVNGKDRGGQTALIVAARNSHMDVLRLLVDQYRAEVDIKTNDGFTALIWSARCGCTDAVRFLADQHGADVHIRDGAGCSAFVHAAENGHMDIVRFLAEKYGVALNEKDTGGYTALLRAAENGHLTIVQFLADQDCFDVNAKCDKGCTALMLAARWGHAAVVRFLAEQHGAEVNGKDNYGRTALIAATENGHVDVVQYLTELHGADINAVDNEGCTALIHGARMGRTDVVRYLSEQLGADVNVKDDTGCTALMRAARWGYADIVRSLVKQFGTNVSYRDHEGRTALTMAAEKGSVDVIRFLATKDEVDVDSTINDGNTALMLAAKKGHIDVVRILADQHRADVNAKANDGCTALMSAAQHGQVDVVRYLAEQHGVDVNAKCNDGSTALVLAARSGHLQIVQLLAGQHGADVSIKDNDGCTALWWAANHGHQYVMWYLVKQYGSDVNVSNNAGDNALLNAARHGKVDVVQWLVEQCSANVNSVDKDGNSAVKVAANGGYHNIQRMLTPFLTLYDADSREITSGAIPFPTHHRSWSIPPSEVELTVFSKNGNIGGDFQAKWLDADVVVKIFIPDISLSSFDDEVQLWQRLRHPNVLKIYGACQAGPCLQLFVCEYASQGSLWEYIEYYSENDSSIDTEPPNMWKYLREAALGLEYLHERGIVHGDLRCSNILIGSDGMAKLSNFRLSGSKKRSNQVTSNVVGSMRWQAPEVLRGNPPSFQSDVYSLGMCIWEVVEEEMPWADTPDKEVFAEKMKLAPEGLDSDAELNFISINGMLWPDPRKRSTLSSVIYELERLVIKESSSALKPEPDLEPATSFDDYQYGKLNEAWVKLQTIVVNCGNDRHCRAFNQLKIVHDRIQETTHHPTIFARFYTLVTEFYQTVTLPPEQARIMRLSSTRATTTSMHAFEWRINSLAALLKDPLALSTDGQACWQQQRSEQIDVFVSCVSDTFLLLNDLKTAEDRSAFLKVVKAEIDNPVDKYTPEQIVVMKKAYADIASTLEGDDLSKLTPEWFIPWYELIVDEWDCLGVGGFGSVKRAKWLDSDVVVKQVILTRSENKTDVWTSLSDLSALGEASDNQCKTDATKGAEARAIFQREVELWFGFSHPHVVRLFGACHVGRPFFVCEYATNGTLVSYLKKHPDEIWTKLSEAALGVQYLHARGVVHGDLKGNNIVVGSDKKAKVTDFGLSSVASSKDEAMVSGAWQWVAPELLDTDRRPTFASDIYSLGMCIVEALRVLEAVKSGQKYASCLPWCVVDRTAVKYHATRGVLPSRPTICKATQWKLVEKMCALDPQTRIKISTVVKELTGMAIMKGTTKPTDPGITSSLYSLSWEAVPEVITAARQFLAQLRNGENQLDATLSLYDSMWKRLATVHARIGTDQSRECHAEFCHLITDANVATTKLRGWKGSIVSLAETTMRSFALDRSLSKFSDVFLLFSRMPGQTPPQELISKP